ncbi:unnamed protein product [Caenorhabditis angaria]|uniref:NR LBD domain-containing protein n=1 Tax=Caenorhabditis angaria TaxID=860376 RepID=A0A9P1IF63_9PELO|nr:unnamed protein product [Caenorhabditis angaria]
MDKKRKTIDSSERFPIRIQSSNQLDQIIWNLSYLDSRILKLRNSTYNPIDFPNFEQILDAPSILNLAEKYEPMSGWPLTLEEFGEKQRKLNEFDLQFSDKKFIDQSINTKNWLRFDTMLSIEYLKSLDFFKFLKFEDRSVLAKHVTVTIQTMIFAYSSFQNKPDCFKTPDGCCVDSETISVILHSYMARKMCKHATFIEVHLKSIQKVMGFLIQEKLTEIEYMLLKSIAICDPIFELSEEARNIIWKNRQKFSKILLEYCEITYGKRNGPSRFVKLLSYLNLIISHEKHMRIFIIFLGLSSKMRSLENVIFNVSS